ncbi:MAG: type II toxin-antitoxin system RelE/ParE family toxin [Alphaproteobacteria bacterium]|nr:type II toxin-antitoxin system RelE/ParE family toxin [Alphaproteobacteria bacterium]
MPRVLRSAQAEEDLLEIWRYIAKDNPAAADRMLDRIDGACALLAEHPLMGSARTDLRAGLRYFVSARHLILYRPIKEGIEVVRVLHGARHLPDLL